MNKNTTYRILGAVLLVISALSLFYVFTHHRENIMGSVIAGVSLILGLKFLTLGEKYIEQWKHIFSPDKKHIKGH